MTTVEEIKQLLDQCSNEQRLQVFQFLREKIPIHPIEAKLNVHAEVILEAIDRSSDLTVRGVRGLIAEAAFDIYVLRRLEGWSNLALLGNPAYDFQIEDGAGRARIQVKMQRQKSHRPMRAIEAYMRLPADMFVVETQRTRGGRDKKGGETRPYRFGEFDILAVSMQPSTNRWDSFMYTVADWLIPRSESPKLMLKFQPVPAEPSDSWTDNLETCIKWFRSGERKRILSIT